MIDTILTIALLLGTLTVGSAPVPPGGAGGSPIPNSGVSIAQ